MEPWVLLHEVTPGTGDTVVLVPGGLTGFRSLDPLAAGFASRGMRVVAVEPIANELGGGHACLLQSVEAFIDAAPEHFSAAGSV